MATGFWRDIVRVAAAAAAFALLGMGAGHADDRLFRSFGGGAGPDSVGITASGSGEDKEEDGPQALAANDDGKLFLLDQLNGRVLSFDPDAPTKPPQTLALPKDVQPTDLVVSGGSLYVWDGRIRELQPLGPENAPTRSLTETRGAEPADDFTRTAFAQMGSERSDAVDPTVSTRGVAAEVKPSLDRQMVRTRGRGPVTVAVSLTDKGAGVQLDVRLKGQTAPLAKLRLRVRDRLGSVAFLDIDKAGHMFVLGENIPPDIGDTAFAFVARFAANGAIEGVYELPLSQTVMVSRRFVTIAPDGTVYFLKNQKNAVEVIGLGFRATPNAKMVDMYRRQPNYTAFAWAPGSGISMAVGPLTRQRVLRTAYAFEGIRWTVGSSNYGPEPGNYCSGFNGRVRRPTYLIGRQGQEVQGVPYCWGCMATSVNQFATQIGRGTMAGNVCTREDPRSDVAGVDCSSFVSAAWGLSSHFSTSAIPAITKQVENPWDLLPGDALDKPGSHVRLFLRFTPDRQVEVMEASPGACPGRVCRNTYSLSSLLAGGYIPVRYRALVAEPAAE